MISGTRLHLGAQAGISLIETMVAVLVLTVGLLGITAMQVSSLAQNRVSYERSQAVLLGDEIVERIRVNRPAAVAGNYDIGINTAVATPLISCIGALADCSPAQLAANDLSQWKQRLGALLGDGDGAIQVNSVAGQPRSVQVTIQWPPANSYAYTVDL